MATEKFNLSVLDLKGLFCDVLARHLNDGTLTREFVADMKKRGVLTDAKKAKELEQEINFMIHGDSDFCGFFCNLFARRDSMSTREKLRQILIEEDTIKRLTAECEDEDNLKNTLKSAKVFSDPKQYTRVKAKLDDVSSQKISPDSKDVGELSDSILNSTAFL